MKISERILESFTRILCEIENLKKFRTRMQCNYFYLYFGKSNDIFWQWSNYLYLHFEKVGRYILEKFSQTPRKILDKNRGELI